MKRLVPALVAVLALQACQADGDPAATTPLAPGADLTAADVGTDATNNLFARVDMLGGLTVGNRVTSVTRLGIGQYEVTFNRNMRPCAYVATNRNAYSQALNVFTAGGHLSPNGVYVETKNQGGGLTDGPFDLVATCGGTGIRYAVVGYSANLARATAGTTLSFLGGGRYQVRFPAAINTCAYLATVADPDSQLVFSPSGVYTGSGADANSVYIETKNPGGGLQDGVPFHLAVVCPTSQQSPFAVVRAPGGRFRGSAGTTSSRTGLGLYNVNFGRNIAACAVIATRGSVNTVVPFTPATIELASGLNANSSQVQVRDLLFFGGNLIDQAFHAAAVC